MGLYLQQCSDDYIMLPKVQNWLCNDLIRLLLYPECYDERFNVDGTLGLEVPYEYTWTSSIDR